MGQPPRLALSVQLIIQPVGSGVPRCQYLATKVPMGCSKTFIVYQTLYCGPLAP